MATQGFTFACQEHQQMHEKITRAAEDIHRTETIIPVAIAALYAWILKDGEPRVSISVILYFVPPALAVLGWLRYLARREYIRTVERYVRDVEDYCYAGATKGHPQGWENRFKDEAKWYWLIRSGFWFGTLAVTATIAAVRICHPNMFGVHAPHWSDAISANAPASEAKSGSEK